MVESYRLTEEWVPKRDSKKTERSDRLRVLRVMAM